MSKRGDIISYLATTLRRVRGQSELQAQASAEVVDGVVESATVDVAGFFYRGAQISIEGPGIVTANAIASVESGSVTSVDIDIPGGVYAEFITLLSQFGFVMQTQSGDALGTEQTYVPAVTFLGDGSGANGYATVNSAGSVTSVVIDNPGTGYSVPPSISFEPPSDPLPQAVARAWLNDGAVQGRACGAKPAMCVWPNNLVGSMNMKVVKLNACVLYHFLPVVKMDRKLLRINILMNWVELWLKGSGVSA